MKSFTKIAFLFGLFLMLLSSVSANINTNNETSYKITIDANNPRLVKIEASFVLQDNLLYMNKHGAEQFPKRWANFVQNINVKDVKGNLLTIKELPDAQWKVKAPANEKVNLSYEVVLKHDDSQWAGGIDGVAFARDWGVFYTGRTFLILNGKARDNIQVSFQIPDNWRVTAPWNSYKNKPNVFLARNLTDLSESMFFAGTHEEFSVKRNGFELVFALGGVAAQKDSYKTLAQGVLDYYIKLMGGIPNPPPDNKFKKSVVIINAGKDLDGEVIGNHISMILDPNGDQQAQLIAKFIFAHEFFHLWNGKSINVAETTEDWFKEGVTNYYTLKALHNIKVISEKDYFDTLNNLFYRRYKTDSGLGKSSMRDVARGAEKDKHWGLIYGGGLFVGMCQDINIRKETANQKSLDILMRDLFKEYGIDRVPIEKCLSSTGLNAQIENGELRIGKKALANKSEEAMVSGILDN